MPSDVLNVESSSRACSLSCSLDVPADDQQHFPLQDLANADLAADPDDAGPAAVDCYRTAAAAAAQFAPPKGPAAADAA